MLTTKPIEVRHKAILITINQLYRKNMTAEELYEATRGVWVVGQRKNSVEYAMAVYQGIVKEVYRIGKWYPAGTLDYKTRDIKSYLKGLRCEFDAILAPENIRSEYIGFSVGKGGRNPIRYVNV